MEVLSGPVLALVDAVDGLLAQDPTALPGEQALAEAQVVLRECERLQAVLLTRVADVKTRDLHRLAGAASTSAWVRQQHTGADRGLVALAGKLSRVPAVHAAVLAGRLGMPAAVLVARALDEVRRHVDRPGGLIDGQSAEAVIGNVVVQGVLCQLAEARGGFADDDPELGALIGELVAVAEESGSQLDRLEAAFVLLAERIDPGLLGQALGRLVDAVLPLQLEDRAQRQHEQRGFVMVRKSDGSGWTVTRGDLDLETGELLQVVLTAAMGTDPANPADTAAWQDQRTAEETAERDDQARQDQAHAQAEQPEAGEVEQDQSEQPGLWGGLTDTQQLEREPALTYPPDPTVLAPRSRAQKAHDALKLGLRALLDSGALGSRGKQAPHLDITVSADTLKGQPGALPAVTASGSSWPLSLVQRTSCDSQLMRIVLSLGRRVIETSHTERTLKAHERRALRIQWGGRCAVMACPAPPGTPLAPHHGQSWASTGTTSYTDTIGVCGRHHHDIHLGDTTLRLRDGRYLCADGWQDGAAAA